GLTRLADFYSGFGRRHGHFGRGHSVAHSNVPGKLSGERTRAAFLQDGHDPDRNRRTVQQIGGRRVGWAPGSVPLVAAGVCAGFGWRQLLFGALPVTAVDGGWRGTSFPGDALRAGRRFV